MPHGFNESNFLHPVLEPLRFGGDGGAECEELQGEAFHLFEDLRTLWSAPPPTRASHRHTPRVAPP